MRSESRGHLPASAASGPYPPPLPPRPYASEASGPEIATSSIRWTAIPSRRLSGLAPSRSAGTTTAGSWDGDDVALAWRADGVGGHTGRDDVAVRVARGAGWIARHSIRRSRRQELGLIVCARQAAAPMPFHGATQLDGRGHVGPVQLNHRSPARCGAYSRRPAPDPRR